MNNPNWSNRTMWTGDNLPVMRGMHSQSVDLIYLDPPFNSNRTYSAPIGSQAAAACQRAREGPITWRIYSCFAGPATA